jgi:hypothetical protein
LPSTVPFSSIHHNLLTTTGVASSYARTGEMRLFQENISKIREYLDSMDGVASLLELLTSNVLDGGLTAYENTLRYLEESGQIIVDRTPVRVIEHKYILGFE